jgi:HK97 family phage major capsid protein
MTIAAQLGQINRSIEMSAKARQFVNLAIAVALSRGNREALQAIAADPSKPMGPAVKSIAASRHRVYEMTPDLTFRQKAAAAAGTTADSGWALPLADYQVLASAFLESLRNYGAFDGMLGSMRRVPFRTRIGAVTSGASGTTVLQQQIKPISRLSLSSTVIDERKAIAILVATDELMRFGDTAAGNLFDVELANAVALETDAQFVAILTSGATTFASNGATAEHVLVDLRGMLAAITTNARSRLFLLMTSSIAKALSVLHTSTGAPAFSSMGYNGGTIGGIQAVVTDGVPSGTMLLADAQQIAAASDTIQLAATNEAIVAMDTSPDSPAAASTVMTSLWPMNWSGLKTERYFGCQKLTTTGVCVLTGASYSGDSPGP